MALIKNETILEDDLFVFIDDDAEVPEGSHALVTQARFLEDADALLARAASLGVRVGPEENPQALQAHFGSLALIAVWFPKYADGRGYSHARLLRDRYGWEGELRAVGDIKRDQLFYLKRCGFDAFELAPSQDAASAIEGFSDFQVTYQTAADGRAPVYHQG